MKKTTKLKLAVGLIAGITAGIWGIMGDDKPSHKDSENFGDVPADVDRNKQGGVTRQKISKQLRSNPVQQERSSELMRIMRQNVDSGIDHPKLSKKEMIQQVENLLLRSKFEKDEFTINKKGHDPDGLSRGLFTEDQIKKNAHSPENVAEIMKQNSDNSEKIIQLGLLGLDGSDVSVDINLCNDTSCTYITFAMTPDGNFRFVSALEAGKPMSAENLIKELVKIKLDKSISDNKRSEDN